MKARSSLHLALAFILSVPATTVAQDRIAVNLEGVPTDSVPAKPAVTAEAEKKEAVSFLKPQVIQNMRLQDQRGLAVFEAPKQDKTPFTGFRLDWGGAFSQQFQALDHDNTAQPRILKDAVGKSYDANELLEIGAGFNLASANLNLNAQLAPGIRVALESYMSSRHHNEFWVKGGYLQFDRSPIDHPLLNEVMEYVTIKAGMFELNYGDAHFRRSDGGNVIYNPFVENYILDSFNTEIGTEIYLRTGPWMAMAGVTDGQNKGGITTPSQRGPAFLAKLGYDKQLTPVLRTRLTGSVYNVNKTPSANLFGGDRTGSHYFGVLENTVSTTSAQFTSGRINPGLRNELTAVQVNPFVKLGGLELFGVIERATGKAFAEEAEREWSQYAGEVVYRFLPKEQLYVGARYNTVTGTLQGMADEISVSRAALAAGWFVTPNVLLKGEYVTQKYSDFPSADIRNGGGFNGFVVEGAISF